VTPNSGQILIVEQLESDREILKNLLIKEGFSVSEACNGEEAVQHFQRKRADLIFMGTEMPVMNGYDAMRQIKAEAGGDHTPIIFMTEERDEEAVVLSLEKGGDDFISKPVSRSLLRAKINAQLRIQTLNHSLQSNIRQLEWKLEQHKQTQLELHEISNYDHLTSLPNRHFFLIYLAQAIKSAEISQKKMALLLMDISKFKQINDLFGFAGGDEVLQEVTRRLHSITDSSCTLARMGGDDFALFYEEVEEVDEIGRVAGAIISGMEKPFQLEGREMTLGLNVGVSLYPDDADSPEAMLRCAGRALNFAGELGVNRYRFFEPDMVGQEDEGLEMLGSIHNALENGEFQLYYQPQVDAINRNIIGCEVLLRWNHPIQGVVSPDRFVPLLEREGLIFSVGEWVMKRAIEQHLRWLERGYPPVRIAVNFSAPELHERGLATRVIELVHHSGIAPPWFKLEVTETATVKNFDQVARTLGKIRASGIQIAVDDFGTGYSTLSYLQKLPVDIIKIDQQFIKDIPYSSEDKTLVKAVIAMAHNLGLDVVAEGVETEAQAQFLRRHLCEELQGYLFSKPLRAEEFEQLIALQVSEIEEELTLF